MRGSANAIVAENRLPGCPSTEWDVNGAGDPTIVGFAYPFSLNAGGNVDFKVSTDASDYRLDIYRLGYYEGHGARKITSLKPSARLPQLQPDPVRDAKLGLVDCANWSVSASWKVPVDATSGLYVARLVRPEPSLTWRADNTQAAADAWMTGAPVGSLISDDSSNVRAPAHGIDTSSKPQSVPEAYGTSLHASLRNRLSESRASHIYFVVRQDDSRAAIVLQTSDTTWQAYNSFGGTSLYGSFGSAHDTPAEPRSYVASYNRPIVTRDYRAINAPFGAEYPLIRFLERNGYDVTYQSGLDTHLKGVGPHHRVFISSGHDEYWSGDQRSQVESARDRGVHLVFLSGNEVFWRIRWQASEVDSQANPTMVCYKESMATRRLDPELGEWTGTWRDWRDLNPHGSRPENSLTGTMYMVDTWANFPILVPKRFSKHRFWRNTRVTEASANPAILMKGLIGHEFDEDIDNGFRPPGLVRLSETILDNVVCLQDHGAVFDSGTATHHLTLYRASSGALVFGAGTCQWAWGLDGYHDSPAGVPPHIGNPYSTRVGLDLGAPDPVIQQATVNLLADMGVQPACLEHGLVCAYPPSNGGSPPISKVCSLTVQAGQLCITGNATACADSIVAGVEVSVDDGKRWRVAEVDGGLWEFRMLWDYDGPPDASLVMSRAVDDCCRIEGSVQGNTSGSIQTNSRL